MSVDPNCIAKIMLFSQVLASMGLDSEILVAGSPTNLAEDEEDISSGSVRRRQRWHRV